MMKVNRQGFVFFFLFLPLIAPTTTDTRNCQWERFHRDVDRRRPEWMQQRSTRGGGHAWPLWHGFAATMDDFCEEYIELARVVDLSFTFSSTAVWVAGLMVRVGEIAGF